MHNVTNDVPPSVCWLIYKDAEEDVETVPARTVNVRADVLPAAISCTSVIVPCLAWLDGP